MKSIFIVLGVTGENEQQRSWLVKAFPSEREAVTFIEKLESTYESFAEDEDGEEQLVEAMRDLDENFEFDPETGTEYSMTECPFEGSTPRREDDRRPRGAPPSRGLRSAERRPRRR